MVVFNSTVQMAVPDSVRRQVRTRLDVNWSTVELGCSRSGSRTAGLGEDWTHFLEQGHAASAGRSPRAGLLGLVLFGRHDYWSRATGNPLMVSSDPARMAFRSAQEPPDRLRLH